MRVPPSVFCLAAVLATGCASRDRVSVSTPDEYMAAIETIDLDPRHYRSDQAYHDSVYRILDSWLKQMSNPNDLGTLFRKCRDAMAAKPEAPQEQLAWVDPHFECQMSIIYRLSGLRSEAAARVLVDLYLDPKNRWDAHMGEMGADAILRCSKFSLPILREKKEEGRSVDWLIELAEKGQKGIL